MSLITRTYTFSDNATAYGSQVETEISTIATALNALDAGSSSWDIVKAVNSSSTPMIADNSNGSNNVFEARVNGSAKVTVNSTGQLVMGSTKITGLANGSASSDATAFGQLLSSNLTCSSTNDSAGAGKLGEFNNVTVATGGISVGTGETYINITSVTLSAGEWWVFGLIDFAANGYTTGGGWRGALSAFTGNTTTDHVVGDNVFGTSASPTSGENSMMAIPAWRVSITTTTVIYLKVLAHISSGTPKAGGRLTAIRIH